MSKFYSFPKASKNDSMLTGDKNASTGPGAYDAKFQTVKRVNPLWSFNRQKRGDDYVNDTPGPGGYESIGKVSRKAPAFSLQGKTHQGAKENVPGPGAYEPNTANLKSNPKYTFSGKIDSDFSSNKYTPAPGSYDPKIDPMRPSSAKVNFPKAKRGEEFNKGYNVGPGNYEIKDVKGTQGGFMSIGKKGLPDDSYKAPGPGAYEVNRTTLNLNKNIAPYLKSKNDGVNFESEVPGPGQYNANPHVVKARPASCKFGTSTRNEKLRSEAPGAGTYEPKDTFVKPNGPGWKFGTADAFGTMARSDSPGPGAYENKTTIGDNKPKYSFKGKAGDAKPSDTPAPGNYDPKFDFYSVKGNQANGTIIGKDERFSKLSKEIVPGPGVYDPAFIKSKANTVFGKDTKGKVDKSRLEVPGPGNYEFQGEFEEGLKKNRGASMKMRGQSAKPSTEVPGPGAYDSKIDTVLKKGKSVKIGHDTRFKMEQEEGCKVPPGQYEPKPMGSRSNVKIGRETRFKEVRSGSPGPDQYDPKILKKEIKYSMRPKTSIPKHSNVPGPGQYDPNVGVAKPSMPNQKFSRSLRSANLSDKINIGPGQYDVSGKIKGPYYSFGKDDKCKIGKNDLPGPGNYAIKSAFSEIPSYIKSTLKNRLDY